MTEKSIRILVVEDNPVDARLTREAFAGLEPKVELSMVRDGEEALAYLRKEGKYGEAQRPDLILLDLKMPRKDGRKVLEVIKKDARFRRIPVIVLTTSREHEDVQQVYDLNANCYVTKPADLDRYTEVMKAIQMFWIGVAELPQE